MSDAEVKDLNQISKKDIYHTPSGKYIQFIHDHSEKHLMRGNSYRTEVIGYSRARALLGFAGTVQAFVPLDMVDEFKEKIIGKN